MKFTKAKGLIFLVMALVGVTISFGAPSKVLSASTTWTYEGKVSNVDEVLTPYFHIGDSFKIDFTFESAILDSTFPDPDAWPDEGNYSGAVISGMMNVSGYSLPIGLGDILISNDMYRDWISPPDYADAFYADFGFTGPSLDGLTPNFATLGFTSTFAPPVMGPFTDDSLPSAILDPMQFGSSSVEIFYAGVEKSHGVTISPLTTETVTPGIPEPTTMLLIGSGLLGLLGLKRKFKK